MDDLSTLMKNLSLKAILVAFVADFGVTQILATFLSLAAILAIPQARGLAVSGNAAALTTLLSTSTPYMAMGLVCACVGEVIGGLVAGNLAPSHPKPNALAAAAIAILSSFIFIMSYPMWYRVAVIVTVVPCYWLGMSWAMRRNAAKLARLGLAANSAPLAPPR